MCCMRPVGLGTRKLTMQIGLHWLHAYFVPCSLILHVEAPILSSPSLCRPHVLVRLLVFCIFLPVTLLHQSVSTHARADPYCQGLLSSGFRCIGLQQPVSM